MPSLDAPSYYGRAASIAPEKYDHFFRWLPHEFYESITSMVDCPIGWVGLVKLDESAKRLHARELKDASYGDYPDSGWYNVRINSDGLVFALYYGIDATLPEEHARADFAEAEAAYDEWDSEL